MVLRDDSLLDSTRLVLRLMTNEQIEQWIDQPHVQAMWGHLGRVRLFNNAKRWFTAWSK